MILFIQNIPIEGPETIGDFFAENGFESKIVDLQSAEQLPDSLEGIEAVVCFGGPMNVYEEDKYPFLRGEDGFIKKVLEKEVPFLGICLGSQLLAKAVGAEVVKSPQEERGFFNVFLTECGKKDPLFSGLKGTLGVFQWHGDMFNIPEGATLLASSEGCPNQAMRVGKNAYGLQFHVEITDKSIKEWSNAYLDLSKNVFKKEKTDMLYEYKKKKERFDEDAKKMYNNFLKMVKSLGGRQAGTR